MRTTPSSRSTVSLACGVAAVHREPQPEVRVVVEVRAGRDDPVDEPRLHERDDGAHAEPGRRQRTGERQAHGDVLPSIFCVKSWHASRSRPEL
jgi:hypothetical protein